MSKQGDATISDNYTDVLKKKGKECMIKIQKIPKNRNIHHLALAFRATFLEILENRVILFASVVI